MFDRHRFGAEPTLKLKVLFQQLTRIELQIRHKFTPGKTKVTKFPEAGRQKENSSLRKLDFREFEMNRTTATVRGSTEKSSSQGSRAESSRAVQVEITMAAANKSAPTSMDISVGRVRTIFMGRETGDGAAFFRHVADDVGWTVMDTHPLAAHYSNKKAFIEGTFAKLGRVLPQGAQLDLEHLLVKVDEAVVELHSLATAKNGMRFDNNCCWGRALQGRSDREGPRLSRFRNGRATL